MYVRVCACVGQTLLSYARGFPRGPKTYRRRIKERKQTTQGIMCMQKSTFLFLCVCGEMSS